MSPQRRRTSQVRAGPVSASKPTEKLGEFMTAASETPALESRVGPYYQMDGTYLVGREKVREYARAVQDYHPAHWDLATTATCPVAVPIADNEISVRVPRTNERRPDPLYTTNLLISNDAEAWYDGVEFAWEKRFSQGLQFQTSYVFGNAMETAFYTHRRGLFWQRDTGSEGDLTHQVKMNVVYDLPFGQGRRFGSSVNGIVDRIIADRSLTPVPNR